WNDEHCMRLIEACFVALLLAVAGRAAPQPTSGSLRIDHAYARATPPGARTAVVYLTIANNGRDAERLLRASSPAAQSVEMHQMSMEKGMMRMRAVAALDIAPATSVALQPGGYHLMLLELARQLKQGETFPLTLVFHHAGSIRIEVPVEAM